MKSLMLSHADISGGAFIAAYRAHQAVTLQGVESSLWVDRKSSDDCTVHTQGGKLQNLLTPLRPSIGRTLARPLFKDRAPTYRTYNLLPSRWPGKINRSDCELVHLHWCNSETLSIKEYAQIKRPIVQSMHDMWAFCGAEHYTESTRWRDGYGESNKPDEIAGFDIDRYIWNRKAKYWTRPRHLIAVSQWMADCVSSSALLAEWPVSVIPNPLNTDVWRPLNKHYSRRLFNLPTDKSIITFGAIGGARNPRKGYDFLHDALNILKTQRDDIHVVIYGQSTPSNPTTPVFPTSYVGKLHDHYSMIALNSAADVFVNPSIQEAFGQTGSEAHACGLPAVAFDQTGSCDVIEHLQTGYLAQWKDAADLAKGIAWVLEQNHHEAGNEQLAISAISQRARDRAVNMFSYETVGSQLKRLYEQVINDA